MSEEIAQLLEGFVIRRPTLEDATGVNAMMIASDIALVGEGDSEISDILDDWQNPEVDLQKDVWVVCNAEGQIVGYEIVFDELGGRLSTDGYVHPDYCGLGIGTALLRLAEARAREFIPKYPDDIYIDFMLGLYGHDSISHELVANEGFEVKRHFYRMEIDLEAPPQAPVWPEGIVLRPFDLEKDGRAIHQAVEEAFEDHWGHLTRPFETWAEHVFKAENFDPSLVFMAVDEASGEIAGAALCRVRMGNYAWVGTLGVRRAYRGRGLGMALLVQSFGEFWQRGLKKIGLGVDAQSLTGATALYERAGMKVVRRTDSLHKQLRDGKILYTTDL